MAKELKDVTKAEDNYSQWYNDLVVKAGLAENSAVRGCMVIKPYGYAIWEKMQAALDKMFKDTGHQNAYFPLFIPKSFFSKEADHVEGFAKECAVVTHYRLKNDPEGKGVVVDPDAKLEEELIVRPTSETIIWNTYKGWIQSYRDLPILCNQWANVVRWEMRTRLFLRTAEFLWQEGHTAHATKEEAIEEATRMIHVYQKFVEEWMGVPVIVGHKSPNERFAGAVDTLTIEALMQDGKALQSGTSHFLGQNFAKAFDVQYINKEGKLEYVWATSWGVSTRLMGALIMAHSDNNGLVLPPKLAPIQVVLIPIYKGEEQMRQIVERLRTIAEELKSKGLSVKIDDRDNVRSGFKFAEYELKGVPVRLALGPRDLENGTIELVRRDTLEKETVPQEGLTDRVAALMDEIQQNIFRKALDYRNSMITKVDTWDEFVDVLETRAASSRPTGTGRSKPKWRSRTLRKPRSAASRWMRSRRRANAYSAANRRIAAYFSPAATKRCRYRIITTKTDAIQRSVRLRFCRKQVMNYQNDSVRRQDRLLDQPEATELLRRGEYGILCMQRPEGGGYGVPLNYVWDEADAIYIHCAPEGRKLHCLRECDRVTFCIVGKTQVLPARFTTFYESILLDCRARTGLTAEERRRALNHLIGKYSPEYKTIGRQYVEKSFHRTEIIRLDILSWSGKCKDNLHPGTTPPGANSNRT